MIPIKLVVVPPPSCKSFKFESVGANWQSSAVKGIQFGAMGALYLNSMRDALKAFHKEVLTNDYNKFISLFGAAPSNNYYEALAWRGLKEHEVKAFTDLSAEKVNALKNEDLKIDFSLKECPKN